MIGENGVNNLKKQKISQEGAYLKGGIFSINIYLQLEIVF